MKKILSIIVFVLSLSLYSQETINLGSAPNAGDGDNLRTAFGKVNTNFTTIFDSLQWYIEYTDTVSTIVTRYYLTTNHYTKTVTIDSIENKIAQYNDTLKLVAQDTIRIEDSLYLNGAWYTTISNIATSGSPTSGQMAIFTSPTTITGTDTLDYYFTKQAATDSIISAIGQNNDSLGLDLSTQVDNGVFFERGDSLATDSRVTYNSSTNIFTINGECDVQYLQIQDRNVLNYNSGVLEIAGGSFTSVDIQEPTVISATDKVAGAFYAGTTNPTNTGRLNFDGNFYTRGLRVGENDYGTAFGANNPFVYSSSLYSAVFYCTNNAPVNFINSGALSGNNTNEVVYISRIVSGSANTTGNIITILDNPTTSGTISGKVLSATIGSVERISLNPRATGTNYGYFFDTHNNIDSIWDIRKQGISLFKIYGNEVIVGNNFNVNGHSTLGNASNDSTGILGDLTVNGHSKLGNSTTDTVYVPGDLHIDGTIYQDHYESAAYLHPDSTITTSISTDWIFLGDGSNNKFTNIYSNGFTLDGDTLLFVQEVSDTRDSIEFRIQYSCESATTNVNKSVFIGIFVKHTGGTYQEYAPVTRRSRTITADVYYPGPTCTSMPIYLKDGDKIQIRAKNAASTTTLSTQSFGIYLYEQ